jgi:hypothetical protein
MRFYVVTTMNKAGWEETGRRMAESFIEKWTFDAWPLTIYAEDFDPDIPGIEVRKLPAWLDDFKKAHENNPAAHGKRHNEYFYTHDAVKFAHKVAALTDFAEDFTDGVVIWLDADTFTHEDVTTEWLEWLFPEPAYIAWLDRINSHPECGFVMFRCSHQYHRNFMQAFRNLYTSGELFKLRETHDSFVLQWLVNTKHSYGKIPAPASLSGSARYTSHPAVNGPLGAKIDHLKGPRKQLGKTPKRDFIRPRTEAYWRA